MKILVFVRIRVRNKIERKSNLWFNYLRAIIARVSFRALLLKFIAVKSLYTVIYENVSVISTM